ncbi:hypothetical protein GCM10028793_56370 [Nocardiopsis oceani]
MVPSLGELMDSLTITSVFGMIVGQVLATRRDLLPTVEIRRSR